MGLARMFFKRVQLTGVAEFDYSLDDMRGKLSRFELEEFEPLGETRDTKQVLADLGRAGAFDYLSRGVTTPSRSRGNRGRA